jgi:glucose/arabinose dehydrogenase
VLSFTQPVAMLQAPGDSTRWFVVEKGGLVRVFANFSEVPTFDTFVDISARVATASEMGLLGMAFHPDFPADPRVYLSYSTEINGPRVNRVSEFRLLGPGGSLNPTSETVLLEVSQPATSHNGGQIAFGPDRLLYIGRGDGGNGANSQNLNNLLGKMLRISVTMGGYAIPPDNPFVGNPPSPPCAGGGGAQPCPEIFAVGFRNPWRWSFDRGSTALWLADVGEASLEEIDRVALGGNHGWPCFEGTQFSGGNCGAVLPPVAEYGRNEGGSVTGGYVYRGSAIAGLTGRYVFGDFVSGRLFHIAGDTQPTAVVTGGIATGLSIVSFAEDVAGELYAVDFGGALFRVRGP